MNLFVVDFDECAMDQVILAGLTVGNCHDLIKCTRDYAHGLLLKFETGYCHREILFVVTDHLGLFGW